MSTDKEALEQKPPMFSPSLTSKPVPVSSHSETLQHKGEGALYNVTQKGKLILPTAIWIFLIVAGFCFLSLLASLNKTVNTLESLVEIEQANKENNRHHHHESLHHHHLPSMIPTTEKLKIGNEDEPIVNVHKKLFKPSPSWLSFPSWTSLEPIAKSRVEKPMGSLKSIFDSFPNEDQDMISGSMIITSGDKNELINPMNPISSLFGSLMNQFVGSDSLIQEQKNKAPKAEVKQDASTVITANIDKVNININTKPEQEEVEENRHGGRTGNRIQKSSHEIKSGDRRHEEQIDTLEKSIDSLLLKLMDEHSGVQEDKIMIPQVGLYHHENLNRNPLRHSAPIQSGPPFIIPFQSKDQQDAIMNSILPAIFGQSNSPDGEFVISGGKSQPNEMLANRQPNSSPYEMSLVDDMPAKNKMGDIDLQTATPMLSQSLIELLNKDIFKSQEDHQPSLEAPQGKIEGDSIIFIDGQPLISEKKQSLPMEEVDIKKGDDKVKELLNMFFGPSSNSVPPQATSEQDTKQSEPPQQQEQQNESTIKSNNGINLVPLFEQLVNTNTSEQVAESKDQTGTTINASTSSHDVGHKEIEQAMEDLLGPMFSLPQFANEQSTRPTGNNRDSTKETMMCDCVKVNGTNSNSSGSGGRVSSSGPTSGTTGSSSPASSTGFTRPSGGGSSGSSSPSSNSGGSNSGSRNSGGSSSDRTSSSGSSNPGGSNSGSRNSGGSSSGRASSSGSSDPGGSNSGSRNSESSLSGRTSSGDSSSGSGSSSNSGSSGNRGGSSSSSNSRNPSSESSSSSQQGGNSSGGSSSRSSTSGGNGANRSSSNSSSSMSGEDQSVSLNPIGFIAMSPNRSPPFAFAVDNNGYNLTVRNSRP